MKATLLLQEWPLIVMVTLGRLPLPSASTTSCGTSNPLTAPEARRGIGPASSAPLSRLGPLLRVRLVLPLGAVADAPDVAVRVGAGAAAAAPLQGRGGLEDRGAGLLGFRHDLVDSRLAADDVGEDQPAEAAALRARAVVGGQAVPAVEADERAPVRLEEHRDAVVPLDLPAETLRIELLGLVHV